MYYRFYIFIFLSLFLLASSTASRLYSLDPLKDPEKEKKLKAIIEHYVDQLRTDIYNKKLTLAVAQAYFDLKLYPQAIKYYSRALELDPSDISTKILLAQAYLANNDLVEASKLFKELVKEQPRNPEILGGLGRIEFLYHRLKNAENYFQRALDQDPKNFTMLYYLGELRIEQKKFHQAQQILEALLERDPKADWVQQAIERAKQGPILENIRKLVEQKRYAEAIKEYKGQIAKNRANAELYIELGNVYTLIGNNQEAIKLYKTGLQYQPNANRLQLALGYAYVKEREFQKARRIFDKVILSGTDNVEALTGLGRIAALEGDVTKADRYYKRALELNSSSQVALSYLADLRFQQKNYSEAKAIYESILEADPKATWVIPILDDLKFRPILETIDTKILERKYLEAQELYKQLILMAPDAVDNYIRFGKFYITHKQYDEAIQLFLEGIDHNPGNILLYNNLAYAYLYNSQLNEALTTFNYVIEHDPDNIDALAGLGRLNQEIGNTSDAIDIFQLVLMSHPNDITALSYLADLLLQEGNYKESQTIFKKIYEIDPKASWARQSLLMSKYAPTLGEIKALEKKGDIKGALMKYRELALSVPDYPDLYYEMGRLYTKLKRYDQAIDTYQEGLKNNPSNPELHMALGLAYLSMGDLVQARQNLQMSFMENPKNAETAAGLGRISVLTGDIGAAEGFYEVALRLNPNSMLALSYYAELLMQKQDFDKARQLYERMIKIDPKAAWIRQALIAAKNGPILLNVRAYEKKKNYDEVAKVYQQLIKEYPDNPDYYLLLGQFYARQKRYTEAIALYLKGLQINPSYSQLKTSLAFSYLEKGDLDIAKTTFNDVLNEEHDNAEALTGLGLLSAIKGNDIQAENFYKAALRADPSNMTALTYYAKLMVKLNRYTDAEALFKKIVQVDPSAESWVRLSLEDAKHGLILKEIAKNDEAKDYAAEEVLWKQLLLEAPNVPEYYLRMGLFYHRIKQYDKAIDTYNKGITLDPKNSDLYGALGLVYISKKEPKAAQDAFKKSLKLNPKNTDALAGMGYTYVMLGEYQPAEKYILAALNIDPNNVAALSSLGDLMYKQKRYPEAVKAFEKLIQLRPHEKWIKTSLQNSMYGPELDRLTALVKDEKFSEAAEGYRALVQKAPDNPYYYFGLGLMYVRLKEFGSAIQVYLDGLKENPEENELLVALGYAYFFNNDLGNARRVLEKAIEIDAKNPEALAGMGRVNALEENYCEAEGFFIRALSLDPKNQSAITFYGDLLMKQKRYQEAQALFTYLQSLLPNSPWISRAIQDASDGPISDLAQSYTNREYFERAAELYQGLLCAAIDDPARYQNLGQVYVDMNEYCRAIRIFMQGLYFDPDALYLWRSIAETYILLADYDTARCIFYFLISEDPEDAQSWAGLGRIETLDGSWCCAEQFLEYALALSPYNTTTLSYLASLRLAELYNFSALGVYETLMAVDPCPKWVRVGLNSTLNLTEPTILVEGAYHEEDEWSPNVHRWSARYQVYGARALLNYPVSDEMTLWGRVEQQIYELKDLLGNFNIYSFDVQRVSIGERWVLSPCWYIDARAGFSAFSPYRHGSFCMQHGTIGEPSIAFTYHKPTEKATISLSSDSDLVARNFNTHVAKLVGRYFISASYEREVISNGWLGFEGDIYWYRDYVNNTSERLLGWFQWRPPYYSDNILLRYSCKYQTFAKNIPDYYTYKPQFLNILQLTLEKSWHVCWADKFYTSLIYGHGWQDTHTRFTEIIVVVPPLTKQPMVWDIRQFNTLAGNIIFTRGRLQLNLTADYYRDTEKYTMWSIIGGIGWRF